MQQRAVTRRRFLATAAAGLPVLVSFPRSLKALTTAESTRFLSFLHLHTGERLEVPYRSNGSYVQGSLPAVNHVLRDWRTGEIHPIDPELLDLLYDLGQATGTEGPFEVICGYRSPETNALLRRKSSGVAKWSLHMEGKAIDIRLPDVPLVRLRDAALELRRGGVGYYPSSDFVHVDTGRVRTW